MEWLHLRIFQLNLFYNVIFDCHCDLILFLFVVLLSVVWFWEVGNIINGGYKYAEKLLKENIDKLHKVAEILIEKEKISAEEFEAVFNQ